MWTWLSISPGMAVVPPASITTSSADPWLADSVPSALIRPSSIRMPSPAANGDATSPVTMVPILMIAVRICLSGLTRDLSQSVGADDIRGGQSADAGIEPAAIGHAHDQGDLVGGGRVGWQRDRDAIIMRADIKRILMRPRHVDCAARYCQLGERRDPRLRAADRIAQRSGEGRRQHRIGMFEFAAETDDAAFAVAFDFVRAHRLDAGLRKCAADFDARLDDLREVLDVTPSQRAANDCNRRHAAERHIRAAPRLDVLVIDRSDEAADFQF